MKPLNLDYIPNLKNVWKSLQSPFYDVDSHYSVPYTAYATGIAYRTDKVTEDIPNMKNPWDIFWEAEKYTGKSALLSRAARDDRPWRFCARTTTTSIPRTPS